MPALVTPSTMQLSSEDQARLAEPDREGRCVITDHGAFVLINVYLPASSGHLPLPAKGQLQQQAGQQEEPCDNEPCDKGIQGALVSKALAPAGQGPAAGTQHGDAPACRPQGPLLGQGRSLKQAQLWPGIVPVPVKASISQTAAEPQGRGDRYACLLAACKVRPPTSSLCSPHV